MNDVPSTTALSTDRGIEDRRIWLVVFSLLFFLVTIRTAWLSDDAYITLRTVRNLLSGFGPVWNVGERVQAYTHPLWMMALTATVAATREYYFTTITLSIVFSVAAFLVLERYTTRSTSAILVTSLILIFSKAFTDYATSGLENPLTYLLLALFAWQSVVQENLHPTSGRFALIAFVASLILLNRMDLALLILPVLAFIIWRAFRRVGGRTFWFLALAFLPLLVWEGFSILYYGFPFPNTAYAKLGTHIPASTLIQSGVFYLLGSASTDPLTLVVIVIAVVLAWLQRNWPLRWLSVGVVLYLLYVVSIGGDFMTGRFLGAPLLAAVFILAQRINLPINHAATLLLAGGVVLVGFANPVQTPVLSNTNYAVRAIDHNGVADERGHYYPLYGLLLSNRNNRLAQQGALQGNPDPANFVHCGIGMRGFTASDYTHIVDFCGLADALLARLPPAHDPNWRIGHPLRSVPDGYMRTIQSGRNQLTDPKLAQYYDRLNLILRAPLLDRDRLQAIWEFNTGAHDSLIDHDRYRYPNAVATSLDKLTRTFDDGATPPLPRLFGKHGLRIEFENQQHATHLILGARLDRFTLHYYHQGRRIAQQAILQAPLRLAEREYLVIEVPMNAVSEGVDTVHLIPDAPTSDPAYALTDLAAVTWGEFTDTWSPQLLAEFYYHVFYRGVGVERAQMLEALYQQLAQLKDDSWRQLPLGVIGALLEMPDLALHELVVKHLPENVLLVNPTGKPILRYIGSHVESHTVNSSDDEPETGLGIKLFFEVVNRPIQEYTLWFGMTRLADDHQWMIYDYPPGQNVTEWVESRVYVIEAFLELDQGEYEVSVGFWMPIYRERLFVDQSSDYWLNLGVQTVVE